jgi:hypothetical protein
MGLVGKYAIVAGEKYFRAVKIVEDLGNQLLLVEDDSNAGQPPTYFTIHASGTIVGMTEEGVLVRYWYFFNTEEERDAWLEWAEDTPENKKENKILSLVKNKES